MVRSRPHGASTAVCEGFTFWCVSVRHPSGVTAFLTTFSGRPPEERPMAGDRPERDLYADPAPGNPGDFVDFFLPMEG